MCRKCVNINYFKILAFSLVFQWYTISTETKKISKTTNRKLVKKMISRETYNQVGRIFKKFVKNDGLALQDESEYFDESIDAIYCKDGEKNFDETLFSLYGKKHPLNEDSFVSISENYETGAWDYIYSTNEIEYAIADGQDYTSKHNYRVFVKVNEQGFTLVVKCPAERYDISTESAIKQLEKLQAEYNKEAK